MTAVRVAHGVGIVFLLGTGICAAQTGGVLRYGANQEITPFRLTGIEGYVEARYLQDESRAQGTSGAARSSESILTEEIFLMTHSYVYHPGLLLLDIGGGPVLEHGKGDANGIATSYGRQLYNFSSRATFLQGKPYSGAVYYDRKNQTQSVGPAQSLLTEDTRYGFDFALLRPVLPFPLRVSASRQRTQGSGVDQVVDDKIEQLNLSADGELGKLGTIAFQYRNARQESASGNPALPIQANDSTNENLNLDTRLRFGANRQYDLSNLVTLSTYRFNRGTSAIADQRDLRFGLDLRATHDEDLRSHARYHFSTTDQADQSLRASSLGAGVDVRFTKDWSGALATRFEANRSREYDSNLGGLDGSATYNAALPLGQLTAGYTFSYSRRDQVASATEARSIGEQATLTGTAPIALARQDVIVGSATVSNLTRTQSFVEGIDYVLSVVGTTTRIQRLIAGNILDGQTVLIDYAFAIGGTYAADQFNQGLRVSWSLKNQFEAYFSLDDSEQHLRSGAPTSALNPGTTRLVGVRVDWPLDVPQDLAQELHVGGRAEQESRHEVISPYQRTTREIFVRMALPLVPSGDIRLGKRRTRTDYDFDPGKGVNAEAYDLQVSARLSPGVDFSLTATRERDIGAPEVRERSQLSARAQWRIRRFSLSFNLTRSSDAQGATERSRTTATLLARRDF